jgi:ketosteroid isomerase-like protein
MSRENVQIVRSLFEPFEGTNIAAIDWGVDVIREALGQAYSPDVELRTLASGLGSGVGEFYRGADGLVRCLREWLDPFRPRIQAATDAFGDLLDRDGEAVSLRDLRNEIGGPTPPGHADVTRWPPPHRRDTAQAMSQENVELVRSAFAAWNRGDLDAWLAHWDEHAQIYPLRAQLEGRPYHGHKGLRRFLADMAEDWEGLRFEMDEIREADEQIVGSGRFQARGRVSGIELDVPLGVIGVVRKGNSFTRASSPTPPTPLRPPDWRTSRRPPDRAGVTSWCNAVPTRSSRG